MYYLIIYKFILEKIKLLKPRNLIVFIVLLISIFCYSIYLHISLLKIKQNYNNKFLYLSIIDKDVDIILKESNSFVFEYINSFNNIIYLQRDNGENIENSYKFAYLIEQLIYKLLKKYNVKVISMIVNNCPSSVWRIDDYSLLKKTTNNNLIYFTQERQKYIKKQLECCNKNILYINDYVSINCTGMSTFKKNISKYYNIIENIHKTLPFIPNGAYWIIKFPYNHNYYVFSSPSFCQLDNCSLINNTDYKQNPGKIDFFVLDTLPFNMYLKSVVSENKLYEIFYH